MTEIMRIYVSGFWPWLGITLGLAIVCNSIVRIIVALSRHRREMARLATAHSVAKHAESVAKSAAEFRRTS